MQSGKSEPNNCDVSTLFLEFLFNLQHEIEMAAEEHETYQKRMTEKMNQLKVDSRTIETEIRDFEGRQNVKRVLEGSKSLTDMVNQQENEFMEIWHARKSNITKFARYAILRNQCNEMDKRLDEIIGMIKSKLALQESRSTLTSAVAFHNELKIKLYPELKRDIEILATKSSNLAKDHPDQEVTIQHLNFKLQQIDEMISSKKNTLDCAELYFQNRIWIENFMKDIHQKTLNWSRKLLDIKSAKDCDQLKIEVESFLSREKPLINQKLNTLIEQSYNVFGNASKDGLKLIQKEYESALDAITNIIIDINKKRMDASQQDMKKPHDVHVIEEKRESSVHYDQTFLEQPPPR